jgi:iron complex outermembrane receptor protein
VRLPRSVLRRSCVTTLVGFTVAAACPTIAAETSVPETVIVTATPIPGGGVARDKIAANPRVIDSADIRGEGNASILKALESGLAGVSLDQAQNNPFQPNMVFRGFEASPLAGDAQGLAVYVNGVRFNQAFGDTVNWDLIPDLAVERMTLEGSNAVFGLNALGGSLAVQMKNGFTDHGASAELSGGSFGRISGGAEVSLGSDSTSVYLAANRVSEDGWRPHSPSDLRQIYGDLGWRNADAELHLNVIGADNDLTGNGTSPVELLAVDRRAIFTYPDSTHNRYIRISPTADIGLGDMTRLQAIAYYGRLRQHTENGDAADAQVCETDARLLCTEDGDPLTDSNGNDIPNFLIDSPYQAYADRFDNPEWVDGGPYAFLNHTSTRTISTGIAAQITNTHDIFGLGNHLVIGASLDHGATRFAASTEIGALTLDRGFAGPGVEINSPGGDITPVGVTAHNTYTGIYISDIVDVTSDLSVTLAGRYNRARVRLIDQLGTALNGTHHYSRFNPDLGLAYKLTPELTAYARYSEANRIPTPAELSCADPASPCSLTNFFIGDPPLDQVVAHAVEAGFRGRVANLGGFAVEWNVGGFTTTSDHDIQYVASGTMGRAYFRNIGSTRRRGLEAGLTVTSDHLSAYLDYALTDATYRTALILDSPNNPVADAGGQITVSPGDRLPGIAKHSLKFGARFQATGQLSLALGGRAVSGQYLFGDEANLTPKTSGYVVLNAHASYTLFDKVELYVTIDNLLDKHYATYGTFSATGDVPLLEAPGATNTRALSPAPPIAFYGGTRIRF